MDLVCDSRPMSYQPATEGQDLAVPSLTPRPNHAKNPSSSATGTASTSHKGITPTCLYIDKSVQVDSFTKRLRQLESENLQLRTEKKKLQKDKRKLTKAVSQKDKKISELRMHITELQPALADHAMIKIVRLHAEEEEEPHACYLMDMIKYYGKERPRWSDSTIRNCIIWRQASPSGYEIARTLGFLHSPCESTLRSYLSELKSGPGASDLAMERLRVEFANLPHENAKYVSVVIDCTHMQGKLYFNTSTGEFEGLANVPTDTENTVGAEPHIANQLLCFMLHGLNVKITIPVSYWLIRYLDAKSLRDLTLKELEQVESVGFAVVRIVTDNAPVNVRLLKLLSGGVKVVADISHPFDSTRRLFLSYDYVHEMKTERNHYLEEDMADNDGKITGDYVRAVYELQKPMLIKPIRGFYKRHVYMNTKEMMSVKHCVRLYDDDVIEFLGTMMELKETVDGVEFADAGPTIRFMKIMQRFFRVHDVTERTQAYRTLDTDRAAYTSIDDPRLEWMSKGFPDYLRELQAASKAAGRRGLTRETFEAMLITCESTVSCVRYLLTDLGFHYVLTRKFSSDCIEGGFGGYKSKGGGNRKLDCRSAESSIRNHLVSGLLVPPKHSNILEREVVKSTVSLQRETRSRRPPRQLVPCEDDVDALPPFPEQCPDWVRLGLSKLQDPTEAVATTVRNLARAMVGGYLVRCVSLKVDCVECLLSIKRPRSDSPLYLFIRRQDRGNLTYPAPKLVAVIEILEEFCVECTKYCPKTANIKATLQRCIAPYLMSSNIFTCEADGHKLKCVQILLDKFINLLMKNLATKLTAEYGHQLACLEHGAARSNRNRHEPWHFHVAPHTSTGPVQ